MVVTLKKVLISDEVDARCAEILQTNGIEVVKNTKLSKEELIAEIGKYDGLIVRSATKVTADVLAAATNLKIIGRAGTGVDNIDCNLATKKGIIVMNTPGGNTLSAAEHTCAMICSLSREIPQAVASVKDGRWERKKFMGSELYGKTLGIIGLGRIGKEVAIRMQSFGMTTIGFDPIIPAEVSVEFNVEWLPLDQIWPRADYITVHTPLIPATTNLINEKVFAACKKGVRVINVARGGIIDEVALLKALESRQCGGAGLDVYVEEPLKDFSLVQHPKVICTPHLGANTVEAQSRVAMEIAEQFVDLVQGKSLFGAINAQALSNALSPTSQPIISLGDGLGRLAGALGGVVTEPTTVTVQTYGSSLRGTGAYLGAAVLAGILKTVRSGNHLNLISAPVIAKELGYQLKTSHEDSPQNGYPALVTVTLQSGSASPITVSGTSSGASALLVAIGDATLPSPFSLQGDVIAFRSQANPQILSAVSGALAGANSSLLSYGASVPVKGQMWGFARVTPPVGDLSVLKLHTDFSVQLAM
ncbi:LOW QUALITY PROTEIN: D-3-phosphoglycerate dehydrogenase-like [Liolophura sinensis]|uniref:LOW QUALITY PROTEIN: D-3-phosphoglycerate dehydrogenase-like n=1 Tax=Liolophura sinensis TaxID=3198878 RepID=UPI003159018F